MLFYTSHKFSIICTCVGLMIDSERYWMLKIRNYINITIYTSIIIIYKKILLKKNYNTVIVVLIALYIFVNQINIDSCNACGLFHDYYIIM